MFSALAKKSPNKVFIGILLGGLSGVIYSLLIPLLTSALQPVDPRFDTTTTAPFRLFSLEIASPPIAIIFGTACILIVICRTLSQVILARTAMDVASDMRIKLYGNIACAPVSSLEYIGSAKLVTTITTDVPRIVMGAQVLPDLLVSAITLIGMLSFLLYLNTAVFRFVLECILFGAVTFEIPVFIAKRFFIRAGSSSDALQKSIDGLIRGIKELKLNDAKRDAYFDTDLFANEQKLLRAQKTGNTVMKLATSYGDMICFFAIGAIAFVFVNYHSINNQELIGVVMALLYITGPISVILNMMPQLTVASVSFARVSDLIASLPDEKILPSTKAAPWKNIKLIQVRYQHMAPDETPGFEVGPLDLEFNKGEITFIVGGNGSGKSTLCKLLTLHYPATSGEIYFGDSLITPESIGTYRQEVAAIYSDYYLFERLLGNPVLQSEVEHYLRMLKLEHKVSYENGRFSTLALSDGQRRRVALVAALVEDKEFYLFDEWAADQDPSFKEAFYSEILPSLRAKNKVVIVITHDDRYFNVADKVISMADGVVASTYFRSSPSALASELVWG